MDRKKDHAQKPEDESKLRKFGRIFRFLRPYRARLFWLIFMTAVLSVLAMLPPLVTRGIIDDVITKGDHSKFVLFSVLMVLLPILSSLCGYIQSLGIAYVGQRFVFDVRNSLYDHLLRMSMRFYGEYSVGKLANRLMGDTGTVQSMLTAQSVSIISDLICSAFAVTATFMINWRLASLLVIIIILFVVNYRLNITRIRRATRGYWSALDRLSGGVENRLVANVAVKTFGTETREQQSFTGQSDTSMEMVQTAMLAGNSFSMNMGLIEALGRTAIFYLGCGMVLSGSITYGDVVAFTTYAMQLLGPAVRFTYLARQLQDVGVSIDRLIEILNEKAEITDTTQPVAVTRLRGKVDFDHVFFHYEESNPVLTDFDLHVAAGETVALIGPTGCGKSTVLSLILRFFDVCKGTVKIDDVDIRDIRLKVLRKQFGIVLQEPLLFGVSIADNVRYSRPGATQADIEAAAKVAEIHDFILTLPDGYESLVGSEGVQLSVGQKQRLTIARAVVADPVILIMDEATSALDSESERAIQLAMERVLANRTSFIVAHRLSTIRNADRIVLLRSGSILEIGNHDQLMAIPNGQYRELYNKHMGKGVLEEE